MEQPNLHRGGEQQPETENQGTEPVPDEQHTDTTRLDSLVREGLELTYQEITNALRDGRSIDQPTARAIAALLRGEPGSALDELASTGTITEGLAEELAVLRESAPTEIEPWLDALDDYVRGQAAYADADQHHEPDALPTEPAAGEDGQDQQQAAVSDDAQLIREGLASVEDGGRLPDRTVQALARYFKVEQHGALAVLGGCGALLDEDDQLYRELFSGWKEHTAEQQAWAEALRRYCMEHDGRGPVDDWAEEDDANHEGHAAEVPRIWVGSLSDYNNGVLHGVWMRADRTAEELHEQIGWVLLTSPTARRTGDVAEEWGIFDFEGFGSYRLGEYTGMELVSRMACGIARHGEAYAAWVALVGDDDQDALEDDVFTDHYEGTWDSLTAYAEYFVEETGLAAKVDEAKAALPKDLPQYLKLDVDALVRDWEYGGVFDTVEAGGGGVMVFRAR